MRFYSPDHEGSEAAAPLDALVDQHCSVTPLAAVPPGLVEWARHEWREDPDFNVETEIWRSPKWEDVMISPESEIAAFRLLYWKESRQLIGDEIRMRPIEKGSSLYAFRVHDRTARNLHFIAWIDLGR